MVVVARQPAGDFPDRAECPTAGQAPSAPRRPQPRPGPGVAAPRGVREVASSLLRPWAHVTLTAGPWQVPECLVHGLVMPSMARRTVIRAGERGVSLCPAWRAGRGPALEVPAVRPGAVALP